MVFVRTNIFDIRFIYEFWYSMLHSYEYRTKNLWEKIKIFVKSPKQTNHSGEMPNKILADYLLKSYCQTTLRKIL